MTTEDNRRKHRKYLHYVFTEQRVSKLEADSFDILGRLGYGK